MIIAKRLVQAVNVLKAQRKRLGTGFSPAEDKVAFQKSRKSLF